MPFPERLTSARRGKSCIVRRLPLCGVRSLLREDLRERVHFLDKLDGDDREVLTVSSQKGHEGLVHAAKEVISFVSYLGYQTIQVRSDNEPAMESRVMMVVQARSKGCAPLRSQPTI